MPAPNKIPATSTPAPAAATDATVTFGATRVSVSAADAGTCGGTAACAGTVACAGPAACAGPGWALVGLTGLGLGTCAVPGTGRGTWWTVTAREVNFLASSGLAQAMIYSRPRSASWANPLSWEATTKRVQPPRASRPASSSSALSAAFLSPVTVSSLILRSLRACVPAGVILVPAHAATVGIPVPADHVLQVDQQDGVGGHRHRPACPLASRSLAVLWWAFPYTRMHGILPCRALLRRWFHRTCGTSGACSSGRPLTTVARSVISITLQLSRLRQCAGSLFDLCGRENSVGAGVAGHRGYARRGRLRRRWRKPAICTLRWQWKLIRQRRAVWTWRPATGARPGPLIQAVDGCYRTACQAGARVGLIGLALQRSADTAHLTRIARMLPVYAVGDEDRPAAYLEQLVGPADNGKTSRDRRIDQHREMLTARGGRTRRPQDPVVLAARLPRGGGGWQAGGFPQCSCRGSPLRRRG